MYFEICALLVTSYADLEESTFEVDYDVHSIVLTASVSRCAHKAVLRYWLPTLSWQWGDLTHAV